MKMRIQGDAIRFRLTRPEVEQFAGSGRVETAVHFPGGVSLSYVLERSSNAREVEASFDGRAVRLRVPDAVAAQWTGSDEVSMTGRTTVVGGALEIVVEKDFQCLHKGDAAKDPNAYPNPAAV